MNRFIEAFRNLFRIPDLRNRVLFTLALLAVYRIGAHIPTPGINARALESLFSQGQGSVLGIFDSFSGGNHTSCAGMPRRSCGVGRDTRLVSPIQIEVISSRLGAP